jgi:hypothetical protein
MSDSIDDILAAARAADRKRGLEAIEILKGMMRKMQQQGIFDELEITFNGCGDSGEFVDVSDSQGQLNEEVRAEILDFLDTNNYILAIENSYSEVDGKMVKKHDNPKNIYLFDVLYHYLEMKEPGWEINEGSSGSIWLSFEENTEPKIKLTCNVVTTDEHEYED